MCYGSGRGNGRETGVPVPDDAGGSGAAGRVGVPCSHSDQAQLYVVQVCSVLMPLDLDLQPETSIKIEKEVQSF